MTCIVGMVYNGYTYVGADSSSVNSGELVVRETKVPKVFRRGPFVIGYTTSFRMGQLLEHWLDIPDRSEDQSSQEYMVVKFVEEVRQLFKSKGFSEVKNNNESGGSFLVGYGDHLYAIHSDFQVSEMAEGFDSVGCGKRFALGAMKALSTCSDPVERITKSLEIASHFSAGVCPPFHILSTKRENNEK